MLHFLVYYIYTMAQQTQRPQFLPKEQPQYQEGMVERAPVSEIHESVPKPEMAAQPEIAELHRDEPTGSISESIEGLTSKLRKPKQTKKTLAEAATLRDELTKEVEHIMEDGLKEAFKELSPREAQAFKIKGEETAKEIRTLLKSTKVKVKKIFQLLFSWLKLLPGVNVFFLEQEAKIKADKIMALHRKQMSHRALNITIKK